MESPFSQAAVDAFDNLIRDAQPDDPSNKQTAKKFREGTRKALSATMQLVSILEGLAELHPTAKAAVTVFKSLVTLEDRRRENNEQIIAVYRSMIRVFAAMNVLQADIRKDSPCFGQLEDEFNGLIQIMKKFGTFAEIFYDKGKTRLVRLFKAGEYQKELQGFSCSFRDCRDQLTAIVAVSNASNIRGLRDDMQAVMESNDRVFARLRLTNKASKKAMKHVAELGGITEVLKNPSAMQEVARDLSDGSSAAEPITATTIEALTMPLEELMARSLGAFEEKLLRLESVIVENIIESKHEIMTQLTSGPHELIEDPDIRKIWEDNKWRLSIKCRIFVDCVYTHFDRKFRSGAADPSVEQDVDDAWTLTILSKVIHHPAIGEAIDEDATGFLSVQEVNSFLKKKPDNWTTPHWALGWSYTNSEDTKKINAKLRELRDRCMTLAKENASLQPAIDNYLESIKLLRVLLRWNDCGDVYSDDILADCGPQTHRVQDLSTKLGDIMKKKVETELEKIDYHLQDSSDVEILLKSLGWRIEQVFVPLLYIIVCRHHDLIRKGDGDEAGSTETTTTLDNMHCTLYELLWAFNSRMVSLLRSWQSQRLDEDLQVECYAGGLMYSWYMEIQVSDKVQKYLFEEDEDEDGDGDGDEETSGGDDSGDDNDDDSEGEFDLPRNLSVNVRQMHTKINGLEKKVDAMRDLVEQLLHALKAGSAIAQHDVAVIGQAQDTSDHQALGQPQTALEHEHGLGDTDSHATDGGSDHEEAHEDEAQEEDADEGEDEAHEDVNDDVDEGEDEDKAHDDVNEDADEDEDRDSDQRSNEDSE